MNEREFKVETGLEIHSCITCGVNFGVPTKFIKDRREDHKTFYCPNGHEMYYPYLTKEEILKRKLNSCKVHCDNLEYERRYYDYKARHWKGKVTKIQKAREIQL